MAYVASVIERIRENRRSGQQNYQQKLHQALLLGEYYGETSLRFPENCDFSARVFSIAVPCPTGLYIFPLADSPVGGNSVSATVSGQPAAVVYAGSAAGNVAGMLPALTAAGALPVGGINSQPGTIIFVK
jgi:hypothetical protein